MSALVKVLGTMLGGFCLMAALLCGCFAFCASQSPDFTALDMIVGCWPFIVGASVLTGLGSLAGFTPSDLGSISEGR
jgi:hypothetical protein